MMRGEDSSPTGFQTLTHLEIFKKFKRLKPSSHGFSSPGVLGCFFFSLCLIFCFFLLDYRTITRGLHLSGQPLMVSWFGFNDSLKSLSSSDGNETGKGIRKMGFLEENGSYCDIFDGSWVWDESYPLYRSEDCMFLDEGFRCSENGRADNFYTKWRWQPKHCYLPRFDAKIMLEKLRNRRLAFVGDSIGRNQWESLLCLLSSAIDNKISSIYEMNGNPITKHLGSLIFKFKDFNCSIEYYRAPFLVLQSRAPPGSPANVKMTLKLDKLDWSSSQWKDAHVLVFNSGHWWNYEKTIRGGCYFQEGAEIKMDMSVEEAFERSIKTVIGWIGREIDTAKTLVVFRSYAPVHFRGGDWKTGGSCHLETLPDLGPSSQLSAETSRGLKIMSNVLYELSKQPQLHHVEILNVTNMTSRRKDAHASLYYLGPKVGPASLHRQDCSHWCLPGVPDSWNELLYAVFLKHELGSSSSAHNST